MSLSQSFPATNLPLEDKKLMNPPSRTTVIKCNETTKGLGLVECGEIICRLDVIPVNSEFKFNFRAWLFTKTFFDAKIGELSVRGVAFVVRS